MNFRIIENVQLTATVWQMKLEGDATGIPKPGQFVQLKLPEFYLRRPISVCDWTENTITSLGCISIVSGISAIK